VLNDPVRVLDRATLLRRLFEAGINTFNAYRDGVDDLSCVRFPCFVRRASTHVGRVSDLIESPAGLHEELQRRRLAGEAGLLVIEYTDVRSPKDGLFRKYGLHRCGDAFVGRHVYVSSNWVQSKPDLISDESVAEESAFVDGSPHVQALKAAFELAGVDYGRADYGLLPDGRVQIWEINTNPMLMVTPDAIDPRRLPAMSRGTKRTTSAIAAIDDGRPLAPEDRESWVRLRIPPSLRERLDVGLSDDALRWLGRALNRLGRTPGVRGILDICRRAQDTATDTPSSPYRRRAA
jgi:hypothetical protein